MKKKIVLAYEYQDIKEQFRRMLAGHDIPLIFAHSVDELLVLDAEEILCMYISQSFNSNSAFEVLDILKEKNPQLLTLPLIMLAIDKTDAFAISAMRRGFQAVVCRPIERRKMFEALKTACKTVGEELPYEFNFEVRSISESEKVEFIKYMINQKNSDLVPVYSKSCKDAYYYPRLTTFFNLEAGQEREILGELVRNNIFRPELINKVNLCPKCSWHTINYRENCPRCKSLQIDIQEVYHHFSCGYVGPAEDFRPSGSHESLVCPKCQKFLRNIGLDYEKPTETFLCMDCHYVFNDPDLSFNCFNCSYTGDAAEAVVKDIFNYLLTQRAWEVVERGSLTWELEKNILMDKFGCFNFEVFKNIAKRRIRESQEFEDPIYLLLLSMDLQDENSIRSIIHMIQRMVGVRGHVTYPADDVLMMLLWRVDLDFCHEFGRKLIDELNQNYRTHAHGNYSIFIISLNDEKFLVNSEVDRLIEDSIKNVKENEFSEDVNILE